MLNPTVTAFLHKPSSSLVYVVQEAKGQCCAVIDPVLDYDNQASRTSTEAVDHVIDHIHRNDLKVEWILETHAHADRITAASYLQKHLGGRVGIGEHIVDVQQTWKRILNLGDEFRGDGSEFDHLFKEGEKISIGSLECHVLYTPGHTKADITYLIGNAAFIGDTLFMTDYGAARANFPGGDARGLYHSIKKIYSLPNETRLFLCHDYLTPERKEHRWETSVAEQRSNNIQINEATTEKQFVAFRTTRDKLLSTPKLLFASVQINMRAGQLPRPESNGKHYLKIPIR